MGWKPSLIELAALTAANTIKHPLAALMDKLGTANRSETVARILAVGQGVLPLPRPPTRGFLQDLNKSAP